MIAYGNNVYHTKRRHPRGSRPLKIQEMIVLLVDLSPSMGSQFRLAGNRTITRLEALKEAVAFILTQKAATNQLVQVSVVGFAERVYTYQNWMALSGLEEILATVNTISLGPLGGLTNIAGALEMGLEQIARFCTHCHAAASKAPASDRRCGKPANRKVQRFDRSRPSGTRQGIHGWSVQPGR